jgi:hypothetical protein
MELWAGANTTSTLNDVVEKLTETNGTAIERHTPNLWPSPYPKHYFNLDLKTTEPA